MDDFVVTAKLRKLVPDLMEAVRAGGDNGPDRVAVQRIDRVLRQHLVQILVTHATCRIAVTVLLLSENREPNSTRLKDASEGNRDLLRAIVEGAHAADPEEHIGPFT